MKRLFVGFWILMILWLREGEIKVKKKRLFYTALILKVETSPNIPRKGYTKKRRYPRVKNSPTPKNITPKNLKKRKF